jgi:preprotein translocase subunit YajC
MSICCWCLLAEGEAAQGPSPMSMLPLFAGVALLFYFMILKPDQKRAGEARNMRANLKKNDRVITSGGIYGVVTNVHREANEVMIKVDEGTGAKLRVTLESIARVVSDETPSETPAAKT